MWHAEEKIEEQKAKIREYLQEILPADTIFGDEYFTDHRIFRVLRQVLENAGVKVTRDINNKISLKLNRRQSYRVS